jgi:hypothetical protein
MHNTINVTDETARVFVNDRTLLVPGELEGTADAGRLVDTA